MLATCEAFALDVIAIVRQILSAYVGPTAVVDRPTSTLGLLRFRWPG